MCSKPIFNIDYQEIDISVCQDNPMRALNQILAVLFHPTILISNVNSSVNVTYSFFLGVISCRWTCTMRTYSIKSLRNRKHLLLAVCFLRLVAFLVCY